MRGIPSPSPGRPASRFMACSDLARHAPTPPIISPSFRTPRPHAMPMPCTVSLAHHFVPARLRLAAALPSAATAGGWALRSTPAPSFFRETYRLPEPELSRWCQLACVRVTRPASSEPLLPWIRAACRWYLVRRRVLLCRTPDACAMDASWDQNLGPLRYSGSRFGKSAANADASNGSRCSGRVFIPRRRTGQGHPCSALPQASLLNLPHCQTYSRQLGIPLIHFIKTSGCICYVL